MNSTLLPVNQNVASVGVVSESIGIGSTDGYSAGFSGFPIYPRDGSGYLTG